ncbi:Rhodanese-related sulfurtransferase [Vanrija albida]|uniref:Ribosome biogenesis regulatory protein n=1 Tax=Vanrija albida TaxID=181172 RepID=A0ABR3PXP3_9TREE
MDVSQQLAEYEASKTIDTLARATPIDTDAGLLAAYDTTPVDADEYKALDPHLLALTLTSTQALVASLFNLPTIKSENGPIAQLPEPVFVLPREKPLPKPKPLTKWERFANEKGISHSKKDKKVWDEERQEWVNRWGFGGKNRDGEDQWLHELKAGDDGSVDPRATARAERKARVAKNERQHARNVAEAAAGGPSPLSTLNRKPTSADASQGEKKSARTIRKAELERSMLVSKTSTASLGRFDNKIEGEPRAKGIKRKFEATVGDFKAEKDSAMTLLGKIGVAEGKKAPKKGGEGKAGGVNVRKAIRHEERAAQRANTASNRGRGGGRGGRGGGRGGRK